MTATASMTNLSIADFLRAGNHTAAVELMQFLCRVQDPEIPVDVDAVRAQYEATRAKLKAVTPVQPFRIVVEVVR